MLTISLRQFQLKAKQYLSQLPITLTVYDKPVAIVNTFSSSVNTPKESVNITSTIHQKIETPITGTMPKKYEPIEDVLWEDSNWMPVKKIRIPDSFCTTWHEKGLRQDVYSIKRFDGYDKLVWNKNLCRDCIKTELENCKIHGGHLE